MMIRDGINEKSTQVRSFLLIGQSNMAGRGDFGEVEPISNPSCFMLRMGRWQKMSEPINPDRAVFGVTFHSGVGLGASFADEMARASGGKVGLIPCADGGTRLSQWMPGEILFEHAVMMARLAMRTSELSGILWHQGESDCHNDRDLYSYKQRFTAMITELRRQLGGERLPLVIGELSQNITEKWDVGERPRILNGIFHEIADSLPNCAVASSDALTLKPDGIHFDSASLRILGKRYFHAYESLACRGK